ncbi:MAG: type II toxin-antitoxin system VapC family toxin [Actinomycetota bacterium]|nr:type II toxin-antitoxin system VapC family toxin [Actinomycetota bacterium]
MVDERGTRQTREVVSEAAAVATSDISYVETRAALARMRAGGRIGSDAARTARRVLDEIWLDLLSVPPDDELLARAAELADEHSLRGYDSVQLAAATSLQTAGDVTFTCWDVELRAAAADVGLSVT